MSKKRRKKKQQYRPGTYKGTYSLKTEKKFDRIGMFLIFLVAAGLVYLVAFHTGYPGSDLDLKPWGRHGTPSQASVLNPIVSALF